MKNIESIYADVLVTEVGRKKGRKVTGLHCCSPETVMARIL